MTEKKPVPLMDRIAKAIEDTARVDEFEIRVYGDDCEVYIRTTWGPEINHHQHRDDWRRTVTAALDELDDIKPGTEPSTTDKE